MIDLLEEMRNNVQDLSNLYYDADPEIQKSEEKIQYFKTLVETLSDIVDTIKWRHQTISNIIKWKQFQSGN